MITLVISFFFSFVLLCFCLVYFVFFLFPYSVSISISIVMRMNVYMWIRVSHAKGKLNSLEWCAYRAFVHTKDYRERKKIFALILLFMCETNTLLRYQASLSNPLHVVCAIRKCGLQHIKKNQIFALFFRNFFFFFWRDSLIIVMQLW